MVSYCSGGTPTLANANNPSAFTTIDLPTSFTCNTGYTSTGGSIAPYYLCDHNTATTGLWSSITYSCNCMLLISHGSWSTFCHSSLSKLIQAITDVFITVLMTWCSFDFRYQPILFASCSNSHKRLYQRSLAEI